MNDLTPYLKPSGYRINAGNEGVWFDDGSGHVQCVTAPKIGIDSHLLKIAELCASDLGLIIVINSVDTGQHVPGSRHYEGRAFDTDQIGAYGETPLGVNERNPHVAPLIDHLILCGFTAGHEAGPYPAVLFGPSGTKWNETKTDHSTHVHVSIPR